MLDKAKNDVVAAPLFVDLDGSLIATDSLWESVLRLAKFRPLAMLLLPFWLLKGKAFFKKRIADHLVPDATLLPYQQCVLDLIHQRQTMNGNVILATAADSRIAQAVANHLGCFSSVIASDGETNLSGSKKLAAIRSLADDDFDYVGDTWVDIPIWRAAKRAIVVDGNDPLLNKLQAEMPVTQLGKKREVSVGVILRAMRCHQWIKNILLFVPMFLAHQIGEVSIWINNTIAFFSFSLVASSVYVLNDILDVESDRSHPQKKQRPFAAGLIPLSTGLRLSALLLIAGLTASFALVSATFAWLTIMYLVVTLGYSFYFKRQPVIDLLLLAWFYTHRVVLGGEAVDVEVSQWLYGFSIFFFMSLAMLKRFTDLLELEKFGMTVAHGRSYESADLPLFRSMGPATGFISVFVLAMYISIETDPNLYAQSKVLWLICPILLYWIMRLWFLANRGQLDCDPIVFALRDTVSHGVAVVVGLIIVIAAVGTPWL